MAESFFCVISIKTKKILLMDNSINISLSPDIIKALTKGEFISSKHIDSRYKSFYKELSGKENDYRDVMKILGYELTHTDGFFYVTPKNIPIDRVANNKKLLTYYWVLIECLGTVTIGGNFSKAQIVDCLNNSDHMKIALEKVIIKKDEDKVKTNDDKICYVLQQLERSRFIEMYDEERQKYVILDAWSFIERLKERTKIINQAYLNKTI